MKHYLLIIFVFLLNVPVGNAQDANHVLEDFSSLSEKNQTAERVDTLVKYIRKEFYKNNYGNTISVGEETLKLAKQLGDQKAVFRISSLLGNAFLQLDDTLQARRIFYRTLQDAKRLNDTTRSLTTARIDLGNYYALQEKNDLAIYQYEHAIPLARKLKDTTHLFILNYNIAELYLDQENIFEASHYVNQVDLLVKGVKAEAYQAVASLVKGRLHFLKNEPEAATVYLAESVRLAEKSGYNDALIEAYGVYAKAEMALENYESAANLLLKADEYKSEKYKTDKIKALEKVTAKFKINQYEQELAAQSLQNEINQQQAKRDTTVLWIKIASGILLLFSIILLISYIKRRRLMNDLVIKNEKYLEAKELSEAQVEAKSKLFSNITHELRTPMYGIIGISSLLQDDPRLYHQNENLNSLKFSADYLLSLINNVLQFNKMNSTHEKLKRSEFNLRELIQNVVESTKYLNTAKPNSYHIEIDEHIPHTLVGDDIKVSQILMNLLSNASKFTHNGFITIEVEREDDEGDN
ncbi:MAG: tetratricopeptide repeat protein, partial [Bacteroidia bacterium]|nr:tetratricopeptide repeat protein [Bacteroidia bacterium]